MVNDFPQLDREGHDLSAVAERWCYDCLVHTCSDDAAEHEGHKVNTTAERYCFVCEEMHSPEDIR